MKKLSMMLLAWYLFVNSSEPSEWYIEVYSEENVIIKVGRDEYLEHKALFDERPSKDFSELLKVKRCEECGEIMHDGVCHKCLMRKMDEYGRWEHSGKEHIQERMDSILNTCGTNK